MVLQEVLLVEAIAEILQNIDTRARVIVRRYPMLRDDRLYRSLIGVDNIVFDDCIDRKEDRLVMTEAEILTKLSIIEGARGVIHVGSTIGFESCYLDTPVLQIHHRGIVLQPRPVPTTRRSLLIWRLSPKRRRASRCAACCAWRFRRKN